MKHAPSTPSWFGIALLPCLLALPSCGTTPNTSFYMLAAVHADAASTNSELTGISLGVGPVQLPHYLDRPEIVSRSGSSLLQYGEFDQWAEPLNDGFARVLAENLTYLLPARRTVIFPWKRAVQIDFQLVLDVASFEVDEENKVALTARWAIAMPDGTERIRRESRIREQAASSSYADTVDAMSRSIAELSREIAEAFQAQ